MWPPKKPKITQSKHFDVREFVVTFSAEPVKSKIQPVKKIKKQ